MEDSFGSLLVAQNVSSKQNRLQSPPPSHRHAQSSNPSKLSRRKTTDDDDDDDHHNHHNHNLLSRPSKHAPTELSSKKSVSRKRPVLPSSTRPLPRDPRFLPLCGPLPAPQLTAQHYSFLTSYLTDEIATLKSAIAAEKSPEARELLQRALVRQESRAAAQRGREAEQEVLREHRAQEKAAVRGGKRPFYMKKAEQKRAALVKRFEGLKGRDVEKALQRRRRKRAARERKGMPRERERNVG
ncbi:MAG: hypothetical protein LQ342_000737 [Letrouitia transgressa]|nr:MAG: hypothetical protein LQ342_000737 [Letrouitia transgressa]